MIPSVTYSRPRYASQNVPPTQINQPIHDSGVSKILNFSQSVSQNIEQRRSNPNPLQQQQSTTNYSQPQFDESNKKKIVPAASLRVPDTISPVGGNLADFAAQMTCLFWFESTFVLQRVAECPVTRTLSPLPSLAEDAVPSPAFRKWVTTILATTQVTQNVILLALLFIYRLKKLNPSVQGNPGSEFRLLTVALMLGNKFLDDSTYTNKTWAEVSGINVQEIHVMEVEFLSNMRYSLFVSTKNSEWDDWHVKLSRFKAYWDRASQGPLDRSSRYQLHPLSNFGGSPQGLPSPNLSPPYIPSQPPALPAPTQAPNPPPLNPPHVQAPLTPMPQPDFSMDYSSARKRSMDHRSPDLVAGLPPAKRPARSMVPKLTVTVPQFPIHVVPATMTQPPRPLPPLQGAQYPAMPVQQYVQQPPVVLPPAQPTVPTQLPQLPALGRAMSMVYPTAQSAPPLPPHTASPLASLPSFTSNHTSPYSSANVSPSTPSYSQNSPMWFLGNRHSPYRPVRSVNTLLVPPQHQPAYSPLIDGKQMHYHSLGKARTEYKTGVVPHLQSDPAWPPQ
ncbi:hypothetical protein EX30DRAFT_307424 [Ascodesmis nigricans]|uniref:Cyclin-domain-containing protein n=1 Tax=Ascodesmis nigricans TaxID=341454 RepID=A0A4S2MVC5_9PEZI|nr:hypothetical protein EX30DRAFT_307424 [Ascodesmis nigricans]